jgi:hypothetical protein
MTLDWSFASRRDWGSPPIPEKIDLKNAVKFAPEVLRKPRWLATYLRSGGIPELSVPNLALGGEEPPNFFGAYGQWMGTPLPTWEDVAWLREQWGGPFMLKGVTRPTTPAAPSTPASPRSRSPPTVVTTSTARRGRSARCPGSSTRSATRSR